MMNPLFEFKKVTYTASSKNNREQSPRIITDATFVIEPGGFTFITGPSGAGKTTLLRLFNRLADCESGEIFLDGKNIRQYPIIDLRLRMGWVPQVPVRFNGTLEDNLKLPFEVSRNRKYTESEISSRISDLMELGLLPIELLNRAAEDLSVGEAQRMNLLRALALEPDILLLDEPTSALDPDSADSLLEQIMRVQRERQLSAIMVSHRPEEVRKVGGVILRLSNGRVENVESPNHGVGS